MTEPLRVVSVFGSLLMGGDENRCLALATHLDPARVQHQVVVAAGPQGGRGDRFGDMYARYAAVGVQVHDLGQTARTEVPEGWARRLATPRLLLGAAWALRRWIRRHRIDVVDARLPTGMLLSTLAARGMPVAVVGTDYFPDWWEGREGRWVRELVFSRLDALITDSRFMREAFAVHLGNRAHLVHNGIPCPKPTLDVPTVRRRLGLSTDPSRRLLTQVSRLIPYKGQEDALALFARLAPHHPDLDLALVGFDGLAPGFAQHLREQAQALGLADRVAVGGWQGPIADVWGATHLQLQPTHRDSSPIAIHEAMALSIPAVVTDVAGLPELVDDGVSGFVVGQGDVVAAAERVQRLLTDPSLHARLGTAARARWEARHTPEHMVDRTLQVFRTARARRD